MPYTATVLYNILLDEWQKYRLLLSAFVEHRL